MSVSNAQTAARNRRPDAPKPTSTPPSVEALIATYRDKPTPGNRSAVVRLGQSTRGDAFASALLGVAVADLDRGDLTPALAAFEEASHRAAFLADHVAFGKARALLGLDRKLEASTELRRVLDSSLSSPHAPYAAVMAMRTLLDLGQPEAAEALGRTWADKLPVPQALFARAQAKEGLGRLQEAALDYQRVYFEHPLSPEAGRAESGLEDLAERMAAHYPPVPPSMVLERAGALMRRGRAQQAVSELTVEIPRFGAADRAIARMRIAAAKYHTRQYAAAFDELSKMELPPGDAEAERLYYVAQAARRLDRWDEVDRAIALLEKRAPQSNWRLRTLLELTDRLLVDNRPDRYEPLYRACYSHFPSEPKAPFCHWRVAWASYLERRPETLDLLRGHVRRFPQSDEAAAALYFIGRTLERDKHLADAKAHYETVVSRFPNFFYATVARERLTALKGVAASSAVLANLAQAGLPPTAAADFEIDETTRLRVRRAKALAAAGLNDWAEAELRLAARSDAKPHVIAVEAARIAESKGLPQKAIRYVKAFAGSYLRLPIDEAPPAFWRLAFPLPYRESLEKHSEAQGLDPLLVAALVRQESEFDPRVVSRMNAIGLAQIRPPTGRELGRKLGVRGYSTAMLYNADTNLKLGALYIRQILDSLSGNVPATLAAYNAGPSRAKRWLQWGDFREPAEFIETIPFHETRNYVQSVLRNAELYHRLYGPRSATVNSTGTRAASVKPAPAGANGAAESGRLSSQ